MKPSITIICACYNEQKYIEACIESLLAQDYENITSILMIDGRSEDDTRDLIAKYRKKDSRIQIVDNPERIVPYAMNKGFKLAETELIARVDAHCIYPSNYISTLVYYLITLPEAQNVGVCCHTIPADDSQKAKAIAIAFSHPFGVGNSAFRTGTDAIQETDTVPFGCWRKEWIEKIGEMDVELIANQDDEYNARTIQNGGKIYIIPNIKIDYIARGTLGNTWRNFYRYGLYKPLVNQKLGTPATKRQLVPPMFVAGILFNILLTFVSNWGWIFLFLILGAYTYMTVKIVMKEKNPWLFAAFPTLHVAYGIGYWHGIIKLIFNRKFQEVDSRQ